MKSTQRAELATRALAGYVHGPNAPLEAKRIALRKAERADVIVVVEGISDQIAIETLALRYGRDLEAEAIVVVPVGGAQAAMQNMLAFGPSGRDLPMAGFYDADALDTYCRAVAKAGLGRPQDSADLAAVGFFQCDRDLEAELIRSVGTDRTQNLLESQGEVRAFRTFQKQPDWRGQPIADQLHRFIQSKARRSLRYARLLAEATDLDQAPRALVSTLAHIYPQLRAPSHF